MLKNYELEDVSVLSKQCLIDSTGSKNDLITLEEFGDFLRSNGRPLARKHIEFRRSPIKFDSPNYTRKEGMVTSPFQIIKTERGKRGCICVRKADAEAYLGHLIDMGIDLTYQDVKEVAEKYADVLKRPRKMAMRGDRNFTGKVEDEIRGKLAEHGLSMYLKKLSGGRLSFPPFYDLLEKGEKRDEGDFVKMLVKQDRKTIEMVLPEDHIVAVKSTNGYFPFAIPENEWNWQGEIYVSVRPHIKDDFLLDLLNAALGLDELNLNDDIGWLEVEGWITKQELHNEGFVGKRLPGKYQTSGKDWDKRNVIMHPLQLHRTKDQMMILIKKYLKIAEEHS